MTAETSTGSLTSHDPAYTAHSMLAAAASVLLHFHAKFFSFYDQLIVLIVTLAEETKKTAVVAGGRLQHDLHQGIFQKFQEAHQGYAAFNVITEKAGIHSILQAQEGTYQNVEAALKKTQEKLKTDLTQEKMTMRGLLSASAEQGDDLDLPGGGDQGPLRKRRAPLLLNTSEKLAEVTKRALNASLGLALEGRSFCFDF